MNCNIEATLLLTFGSQVSKRLLVAAGDIRPAKAPRLARGVIMTLPRPLQVQLLSPEESRLVPITCTCRAEILEGGFQPESVRSTPVVVSYSMPVGLVQSAQLTTMWVKLYFSNVQLKSGMSVNTIQTFNERRHHSNVSIRGIKLKQTTPFFYTGQTASHRRFTSSQSNK